MLVDVEVPMFNALAYVFQEPLNQESSQNKKPCVLCHGKGFRHQVQEAHPNDEGSAERQNQSHVVQPALPHEDESQSSQQRGG